MHIYLTKFTVQDSQIDKLESSYICYYLLMKVRDVIKLIKSGGWFLVGTRGSHRQFKHPIKSGRVTVSGKLNDDVAVGTLGSIYKQAKIK